MYWPTVEIIAPHINWDVVPSMVELRHRKVVHELTWNTMPAGMEILEDTWLIAHLVRSGSQAQYLDRRIKDINAWEQYHSRSYIKICDYRYWLIPKLILLPYLKNLKF